MQQDLVFRRKITSEERLFTAEWFSSTLKALIGATIIAAGFTLFFIPFNIVPGGLFGFSTVISHLTGWPVGAFSLAINIPIILLGIYTLGNNFGLKTIIATIWCSLAVDGINYFTQGQTFSDDILMSTIFGGVFIGIGAAITLKEETTTGGTDTLAKIFSKYTRIPISRWVLVIDGSVVLFGIIAFRDLSIAPYAMMAVFVISKTIDSVLTGFDNRKVLMIISEQHELVREFILKDIDRGGTYINGQGLFFSQENRKIIMTALTRKEMVKVENYILTVDRNAFIMVLDAHEVKGSGFNPLDK